MPFGLIAILGAGIFAISLNEKKKHDSLNYQSNVNQRDVKVQSDGSYRDTYGNQYQRLSDGSLLAIPGKRF